MHLNIAFVIPWFFDAEVLNSGTVVGVPEGETLESQGRNFVRRFEISCQAPLQQMPGIAWENCVDPIAEAQRKQKRFPNSFYNNCNQWSCSCAHG